MAMAVVFEKGSKVASLMIDGMELCGRLASARDFVVCFRSDLWDFHARYDIRPADIYAGRYLPFANRNAGACIHARPEPTMRR